MKLGEIYSRTGDHASAETQFTLLARESPASPYAETALFLDRNSPQFMGGFLEMANARLYPFWGDLTEGLRTGQAQRTILD